jgi:chromosome segregation ATPase
MRIFVPDDTAEAEYPELRRAFADQLKAIATSDANLTPEQRAARLKDVSAQLAAIRGKMSALGALAEARGDDRDLLKKRLEQLRETSQQLELRKAEKEARKVALRHGMERLEKEAQQRAQDDPITAELRKLVALREDGYARVKQLNEVGHAGQGDVTAAQAALAEAKIRLVEREAGLAKGGKGDLLERLSDELAMVSVDLIDLDVQMQFVRHQLDRFDTNLSNINQLDELLKKNPNLGAANVANLDALQQELQQQYRQLHRERFALMVEDVTLQERPASTRPQARPDY